MKPSVRKINLIFSVSAIFLEKTKVVVIFTLLSTIRR